MADIDHSKASALAELAKTAENSALETIADANGAFKLFTDEVSASANKVADASVDNLGSDKQIIHDPSIEAKAESYQSKVTNVEQIDRSMEESATAPYTQSKLESESESHEDSLAFPLAIRSLAFPLSILAWFSNLCSEKGFVSSPKAQASRELEGNTDALNEDLADGSEVQAHEELEVKTNAVNENPADRSEAQACEESEVSTNTVNGDLPDESFMAVENDMKRSLDVSTNTIEQEEVADADKQIKDTNETIENPMKESLDVSTNAIEQDDLANAGNKTDDTGKVVEGAQNNMVETFRVEESVGKYARAIKSQVSSTLEDSLGEAMKAFRSHMNGLQEETSAFQSEASTVEASVGEATASYKSRVEALKIKFESFRI